MMRMRTQRSSRGGAASLMLRAIPVALAWIGLPLSAVTDEPAWAQPQSLPTAVSPQPTAATFPVELMPLVRSLRQAGYTVLFARPPIQGAYGATNARKKTVWVAPITVDLGIARQALIHEAVHAAQGCPNGKLRPIGWSYALPRIVEREMAGVLYRNYPHAKHDVEREAFMMQSHPKAFELITAALKQRCR